MSGALDHLDLGDISFAAFRDIMEVRYDVMPVWWWRPGVQERVYAKWKANKEAEIADLRATAAALANGKRVFKALDKVGE